MEMIARWCFQRRRLVILLWIAALPGTGAFAAKISTAYDSVFSLPGTDSQKAQDLLKREFAALSGDDISIALHARTGTMRDISVQDQAMWATVRSGPGAAADRVRPPDVVVVPL